MTFADAYTRHKGLLLATVRSFQQRHGGDWDDLLSDAHEALGDALAEHNPAKSSLATWIRNRVWWGLVRARYNSPSRETTSLDDIPEEYLHDRPRDRLTAMLSELSAEAVEVAGITVDIGGRTAKQRRNALVSHLLDLGWAAGEIARSFTELQEAFG